MNELIQQLLLPKAPPDDAKSEPTHVRAPVTPTARCYSIPSRPTGQVASSTVTEPNRMQAGDELLTKRELAARLKKTPRCIEQWMRRHYLPYIKIGHTVRFRWRDIIEALERLTIR